MRLLVVQLVALLMVLVGSFMISPWLTLMLVGGLLFGGSLFLELGRVGDE